MKTKLPSHASIFEKDYPDVWEAYRKLGKTCSEAGPLDDRTRRLIKLALAVGGQSEGAVHSHTRQGLEEGLKPEELRQVATLAITTLGFPRAIAALSWVDDIITKDESS